MGRKPLSSYPPEVAAKMRADISRKARKAWENRQSNGLGSRVNGVFSSEVKERISQSVKENWENGKYEDRLNAMAGKIGKSHHNWTWGKEHYAEILLQHEPRVCAFCGKRKGKIDTHHVDERHENYLLSNLQWACVSCHSWRFHYTDRSTRTKVPFVTIGKKFRFEYAHILPWHPGKCARMHGHSGKLVVKIRARLDPNGVVEDFYDVSACVKSAIIERLDHQFLNDFIPNPTSEELLIYVWKELESIGLKGIKEVKFSETDSTFASITSDDMVEAFGWDRNEKGVWEFVRKEEPV